MDDKLEALARQVTYFRETAAHVQTLYPDDRRSDRLAHAYHLIRDLECILRDLARS